MSIIESLSQPIWQRLGLTLVHFLWQGLAVAVLVGMFVRLFRLRSGNSRHAAYLLSFIVMIACPVVTFTVMDVTVESYAGPFVANTESIDLFSATHQAILPPNDILPDADISSTMTSKPAATIDSIPLRDRIFDYLNMSLPWLLVIWMVGVLILSVRLVIGLFGVYRWCHHLEQLPEWLGQRIVSISERLGMQGFSRVFVSPAVLQVMAVGYLRPMVLLPAALVIQMQPEMLEAIIAHELAHIRRFDLWINLLQRITETLFFYHPAVWWLSNRLRNERELCCDELVVKTTGERLTYAVALESVVLAKFNAKQPTLAVGLSQDNKPILRRVRHILGLAPAHRNCPFWLAGVITVMFLTALAISTTFALTDKTRSVTTSETPTTADYENASAANRKIEYSAEFLLNKMLEHRSKVRNLQYVAENNIWWDPAARKKWFEDQIKKMRERGSTERQLEIWRKGMSQIPESQYQILKCTTNKAGHVKIEMTRGTYDSSGMKVPINDHVWTWNGVTATDSSQRSGFQGSATIKDRPQIATTIGHPWMSIGILCKFLEETIAAEGPVSVDELKDGTYRIAFDYKTSRIVAIINPSQGYTCALQENYNEKEKHKSRNIVKHEEVAEGIWFPVSGQREEYALDGLLRRKFTFKSSQIRINDPSFNESYFDVYVPKGAHARDYTHNTERPEIHRYEEPTKVYDEILESGNKFVPGFVINENGSPVPDVPVEDEEVIQNLEGQTNIAYRGFVQDEKGKPIAGAKVCWFSKQSGGLSLNLSEQWNHPDVLTTDKRGEFMLRNVYGNKIGIYIKAEGYAQCMIGPLVLPEDSKKLKQIVLQPGSEVFGRVILEDGQNVVGARISANIFSAQLHKMLSSPWPCLTTKTDENGFYRLVDLPAGQLSIGVNSPIAKGNLNMAQKKIDLESDDKAELNFGDEEGFTLTGIVRIGEKPVERAQVYILLQNESSKCGWTDSTGNFRITGIPGGRHRLLTRYDERLDPKTFRWRKVGKQYHDIRQITINNDLSTEIVLEDRSKGTPAYQQPEDKKRKMGISGFVEDENGNPIAGARSGHNEVQAHQDSSLGSEFVEAVHETTGASEGQTPRKRMPVAEPLIEQGDHTDRSVGLRGQVLFGADKNPVIGAVVHILKRGQPWRSANAESVRTAKQGQFIFKGIDPGEYRIWAIHGDWVSRQKRYKAQIVNVSGDGSAVEPILLHLHEGCVLRVRAVSSITNQPLDQAQVHLPWSDIGHYFPADENGMVTIKSLTQEPWHYEVTAPGHGRVIRVANLQRGMKNIFEVYLPTGGTLSGMVTNQNNQGIEGVSVNLYPTGDGRPFADVKTDQDGAYQLPHVPINMSVDVLYHCENFVSASKRKIVLTEPDQIRTLNVQLKKPPLGGSVIGVVTNQQNQPIHDARAIFHTGPSSDIRKVKTDETGRFRMDDIPDRPGSMILTIRAKGYTPKNVEINPGIPQTPQELSIRLLPGHTITGKVVDETGQPISSVWVFAGGNHWPNRIGGKTHTNQEGHFAFDSLPSSIQFDFEAQGYSSIEDEYLTVDRDDHVVVMEEQGVIGGQVVDAQSGAPIEHFNIRIRRSGDDYQGSIPSSFGYKGVDFSSEEGRFYIDDLDSGTRLMLLVKVPGYAVQVYDPVMVQGASRIEPVTLKYQAELGILSGQIVDANSHSLANLKVHAVVHKLKSNRMSFGSWGMLNSGQLAIQPHIIQVQQTVTDSQGHFQFKGVPSGYAIDLMIQGEGTPKTRREHIEKLPVLERAKMVIQLPKASIITGRISAQEYPDVGQLSVHLKGDGFSRRMINIGANQQTYAFADLEAGTYVLSIHGRRQTNTFEGTFSYPRIGTISFDIKTGETKKIDIGSSGQP